MRLVDWLLVFALSFVVTTIVAPVVRGDSSLWFGLPF
jgi:hypothetical protein